MEDALNIIARLNINLYIKLNPPKDDWNSADIDAKREYVQTAVREHIELYMDDYLKNIDIVLKKKCSQTDSRGNCDLPNIHCAFPNCTEEKIHLKTK